MNKVVDVAVIGAGVTGALSAYLLAKQGLNVTLIERSNWPREKVCGCCLNYEALKLLKDTGLFDVCRKLPIQPLKNCHISMGRSSITLAIPKGGAVSRRLLDNAIVNAACNAGAIFLPHTTASIEKASDTTNKVCNIHLRNETMNRILHAKAVLIADGIGGSTLNNMPSYRRNVKPTSRRGFGTHLQQTWEFGSPDTIRMCCNKDGYVGLVQMKDGGANIAAALDPSAVKHYGKPGILATRILNDSGIHNVPTEVSEVAWKATVPLTGYRPRLYGQHIFIAGDAAGYVEPFTGEGMAWGIKCAITVVPLIKIAAVKWDKSLGIQWEDYHSRYLKKRHFKCKLIAWLLRHSTIMKCGIKLWNFMPCFAQHLIESYIVPGRDYNKSFVSAAPATSYKKETS
ncbi:FAD-dependent monooxygenase [Planctomycetota bacterium]|nr:FAD-dependent monooxygenase [Planctomycetota bacterium]